jgi:hypothetical protein
VRVCEGVRRLRSCKLSEERVDEDELDDVLFDLLEYCKRDDEAMVRIWQRLQAIAMNGGS